MLDNTKLDFCMHALTNAYTWLGLSTGVELGLRPHEFWHACGPQQSGLPLSQQAAQCMETLEIRMTCKCDAIAACQTPELFLLVNWISCSAQHVPQGGPKNCSAPLTSAWAMTGAEDVQQLKTTPRNSRCHLSGNPSSTSWTGDAICDTPADSRLLTMPFMPVRSRHGGLNAGSSKSPDPNLPARPTSMNWSLLSA